MKIDIKNLIVIITLFLFTNKIISQNDGYYSTYFNAKKESNKVKILDITDEVIDNSLYTFTNLKELRLIDCKIDSIKDGIINLSNLEVISIRTSQLKFISDNLSGLKKIKKIQITGSQLELLDFSNNNISKFKLNLSNSIEYINLSGNDMNYIPNEIFDICNLKILNLRFNKIKTLDSNIRKLTKLRKLLLGKNNISFLPNELYLVKQLEELELRDNSLSQVSEKLTKMESLKYLDLSRNPLESLPSINHFEKMDLRKINLIDTNINLKVLNSLKRELNNTKVIF
ncbi:leucine-rich repeat domain-containing protein [Tenacibaculum ovolyticum]|uniref:leucine-rich repeat domain-containing protein n=1 Tax=Tenacibaculum ovolyticum TaxID=104270 RepID=UPI00040C69E3|nr:leucine-rich repeat domain-containing protein [Tenacibaculum ovolyticum]